MTSQAAPSAEAAPAAARREERRLNPVYLRELRQAARLHRTPVILALVTAMMALLMSSIGGVASVTAEPAKVGSALFQTFFSLGFAMVSWVAPAVAASTIASERGNRTWEPLLLTGLRPAEIAAGKFMAALTYVGLYLTMLIPVGALPFLFGGVTATEVALAFAFLFAFAGLAVAFGLSVSSKFTSPTAAIIVTLLVAMPLSLIMYLSLGVGLSFGARELWPALGAGAPVWLPGALVRADLDANYLLFLVLCPLAAMGVPGWFFYEVTRANLSAPSDDRSTGLRRWFLVSTPVCAAQLAPPGLKFDSRDWALAGMTALLVLLSFAAVVFVGEPLGPSARVLAHWNATRAGAVTRYLGPGMVPAGTLLLLLGFLCLGAQTGVLAQFIPSAGRQLLLFGAYATGFFVFVAGASVWLRSLTDSASTPRLLLIGVVFAVTIGPWVVMAIAGLLTDAPSRALLIAAPSPTFAMVMVDAVQGSLPDANLLVSAGVICSGGWALLGLGLLVLGALKIARRTAPSRAPDAALAPPAAEPGPS